MITAELNHNPYLLLTTVRFNGQPPRINSQVEKYESVMLKDWIHKVPGIYHDEMNGYDFDLYFTGTKSDYESLRKAFTDKGISGDDVRLFHKNELEDSETKSGAIDDLLQWLRENRNRKFDFEAFYEKNQEHFESAYPYVIINGTTDVQIHPQVSAECVRNAAELEDTVLMNTPILFYLEPASTKLSREDLKQVLRRPDIRQNQLFFLLHPQLNAEQVRRVILDLGVENPQIVTAFDAESILAYIRDYPITEFVRDSIHLFREAIAPIEERLEEENRESELQNAEIHAQIDAYENQLSLLKEADLFFTERDNFNTAHAFAQIQQELFGQIGNWRNRKTKVVGDAECVAAAKAYEADVDKWLSAFETAAGNTYQAVAEGIRQKFRDAYEKQGMALDYEPSETQLQPMTACEHVELYYELLDMEVITHEEQKLDFKALFRMGGTQEERELVRVVTCYYAQWRDRVLHLVTPVVLRWIGENEAQLCDYYNALAEEYHIQLAELITDQDQKKDSVSAQLSDDERRLQEDNDWMAEFKDKLTHIERG